MTESAAATHAESDDVRLTDVMLAMDVVDTLRHEEALVARALNDDERDAVLLERVRAAYQSQGIEVSEATLTAGVRALREREFQYEPPPAGFRTRLFRAWVRRGRIGRGFGLFGMVAALIGGGWYGFVELPAERERVAAIASLNTAIDVADVDLRTLDRRRLSLAEALETREPAPRSEIVSGAAAAAFARADSALARAARSLRDASALTLTTRYTEESFARTGASGQQQLANQQALLAAASSALDEVEAEIAGIDALAGLPERLARLRDDAVALAEPAAVDAEIEALYRGAVTALRQGDAATAIAQADEIEGLVGELQVAYDISVVSRQGEYSGVIRAPNDNPNVDNYYLIVEALGRDGRPITVSIRSEEDGAVRSVRAWGLRVSKPVFDRIAADKADDGIIQGRRIGRKDRGHLDPDYTIAVQGGLIHDW